MQQHDVRVCVCVLAAFSGRKHKATNWRKTFNTLPPPQTAHTDTYIHTHTHMHIHNMVNIWTGAKRGWGDVDAGDKEHLGKNSFELRCCQARLYVSVFRCDCVCVSVCVCFVSHRLCAKKDILVLLRLLYVVHSIMHFMCAALIPLFVLTHSFHAVDSQIYYNC